MAQKHQRDSDDEEDDVADVDGLPINRPTKLSGANGWALHAHHLESQGASAAAAASTFASGSTPLAFSDPSQTRVSESWLTHTPLDHR